MTVLDMESDRVAAEPPEVAQRRRPWRALFRAMRPHHWVKNLLVFAPLVFSHSVSDPRLLLLSVLAFVVFCAAASVIYLLNDAADVESDRRHPEKRFRPIAAGELRTSEAMWGAGGLLVFSAGVSLATLPWMFSLSVLVYLVVNAAYTFWLKRKVMIDIVVLAGMYTLRMIAGAAATGIMLSEWLLALSTFLFLSLAFLKRHSELRRLRDEGTTRTDNRGYQVVDIELIQTMGSTCGLLAVLVLALYINSAQVKAMYSRPNLLWLICLLLLFAVGRIWIWARRGAIHEDPLVFTLKDKTSWIVAGLAILVAVASL